MLQSTENVSAFNHGFAVSSASPQKWSDACEYDGYAYLCASFAMTASKATKSRSSPFLCHKSNLPCKSLIMFHYLSVAMNTRFFLLRIHEANAANATITEFPLEAPAETGIRSHVKVTGFQM
jgi:hypothetical protein